MRQSGVTHCVCALGCGGLFLPRRPLRLLLLGLFGTLRLLTLTARRPQLLVLLRGKNLFGLLAVELLLEPDGEGGGGEDGAGRKNTLMREEREIEKGKAELFFNKTDWLDLTFHSVCCKAGWAL